MTAAGVPEAVRRPRTKGQIAWELLDPVRAEGVEGRTVVTDARYGNSGVFRDGLADRGLRYVVGVTPETVVFAQQPRWHRPSRAVAASPPPGGC